MSDIPLSDDLKPLDFRILNALQQDARAGLETIAKDAGSSRTAVWNRVKRYEQTGLIRRYAALLDPEKAGVAETFFVSIRTDRHDAEWLNAFSAAIQDMREITEAHRLAGAEDYLLKVQVPSTRAFDAFYRRLIERIGIRTVSSSLSMETIKPVTALPLPE
jgi:Lrp/AsnC family transcriptional regulator